MRYVNVANSHSRGCGGALPSAGAARPGNACTADLYVYAVRPSSRVAFGISWVVFVVAVFLSWRRVLSVPNSDVNGLAFATVTGALGLGSLGAWIQDREGGR